MPKTTKKYKTKEKTFFEGKFYWPGDIVETANGEGVRYLEELPGQKKSTAKKTVEEPKTEE